MNALVPFNFQDVSLKESCWIDRKPYFTRRAIGEWLEYSGRSEDAIRKIVERNPHILRFSTAVKLTAVDGKERELEVYDPIGLQLIINKSNQPRALGFQVWAANLVVAYMSGQLKPIFPPTQKMLLAIDGFKELADTPHGHKVDARMKLAEQAGISLQTSYRWNKRLQQTGQIVYRYVEGQQKRFERDHKPRWCAIGESLNAGRTVYETARFLRISVGQVYRYRREYFKRVA